MFGARVKEEIPDKSYLKKGLQTSALVSFLSLASYPLLSSLEIFALQKKIYSRGKSLRRSCLRAFLFVSPTSDSWSGFSLHFNTSPLLSSSDTRVCMCPYKALILLPLL